MWALWDLVRLQGCVGNINFAFIYWVELCYELVVFKRTFLLAISNSVKCCVNV